MRGNERQPGREIVEGWVKRDRKDSKSNESGEGILNGYWHGACSIQVPCQRMNVWNHFEVRRSPTLHNVDFNWALGQIFTDVIVKLAHAVSLLLSIPELQKYREDIQEEIVESYGVSQLKASDPLWPPALFPSSTCAQNALSVQIFSEEIIKFQIWLGKRTLNHPSSDSVLVSPGKPGPCQCPPDAPVWAWGKHLLHWAPFIRNVCFEGSLHLY